MLFVTHTDENLDGYCAAAAGMAWCREQRIPTDVLITSKDKIARDLGRLAQAVKGADAPEPCLDAYWRLLPAFAPTPKAKGGRAALPAIVVCGVSPNACAAGLPAALDALARAGCPVRWILPYCETGQDGLPEGVGRLVAILEGHCDCQPVAVPRTSGQRLFLGTVQALELERSDRVPFLKEVLSVAPGFETLLDACEQAAKDHKAAPHELTIAQRFFLLARVSQQRYFLYADRETSPDIVRKLAGLLKLSEKDSACDPIRFSKFHRALSGNSDAIKEVRKTVGKLARTAARVMILGETGSGKDIVAEALHYGSFRANNKYIPVNCAEFINNDLLTSQLFGHKKGAFTGANANTEGLVAAAKGGTLFLDEIGEMPAPCQAMLLRFLQNGSYRCMGEPGTENHADVRVLCATNRDLAHEVNAGNFRADLYYRLREAVVVVPPLRERPSDINGLANQRLKKIWRDNRLPGQAPLFTPEQAAILKDYDWPGNVRELHGVVANAFYLSLPDGGVPPEGLVGETFEDFMAAFTENIEKALTTERKLGIKPGSGSEAAPLRHPQEVTLVTPENAVPAASPVAPTPAAPAPAAPGAGPEAISIYVADSGIPGGRRLKKKDDVLAEFARLAYAACGNNGSRTQKAIDVSENTLRKYLHGDNAK